MYRKLSLRTQRRLYEHREDLYGSKEDSTSVGKILYDERKDYETREFSLRR
jgi:hypothetical protein